MSGVLEKPEQNFQGTVFKAKSAVLRGDPGTKRAPVATSLFRSGHQQLSPKTWVFSVPLGWVACGSVAGCCWDVPCWLPSFEVSAVEPLVYCTTVTQSGLCSECHNKYVFLSCP